MAANLLCPTGSRVQARLPTSFVLHPQSGRQLSLFTGSCPTESITADCCWLILCLYTDLIVCASCNSSVCTEDVSLLRSAYYPAVFVAGLNLLSGRKFRPTTKSGNSLVSNKCLMLLLMRPAYADAVCHPESSQDRILCLL